MSARVCTGDREQLPCNGAAVSPRDARATTAFLNTTVLPLLRRLCLKKHPHLKLGAAGE